MALWTRLAVGCALASLVGCSFSVGTTPEQDAPAGGETAAETPAKSKPTPTPADTKPKAKPKPAAAEVVDEEPELEESGGPATLIVDAKVKGESVTAKVVVLGSGDEEVASGKSGDTLTLPAGRYALQVSIEDKAVLADTPTQRSALTLRPGGSVRHPVTFDWASIQLRVRINGQVDKNAQVDILRAGKVVTTMRSDQPHVTVSPGRYEAKVRARGAEIEVQQLMFPAGATRTVPVDVQM